MNKLLPIGDDVEVYSGHGPTTTIGHERKTNPALTKFLERGLARKDACINRKTAFPTKGLTGIFESSKRLPTLVTFDQFPLFQLTHRWIIDSVLSSTGFLKV